MIDNNEQMAKAQRIAQAVKAIEEYTGNKVKVNDFDDAETTYTVIHKNCRIAVPESLMLPESIVDTVITQYELIESV